MTAPTGCDKCNRSSLSLLLLRPSPVALGTQVGLAMHGVSKVVSDPVLMKGLLPTKAMTQSRFALRLLRPGYLHVYYKNPVATASDWHVFRVTNDADLIPESDALFAQAKVDFKCSDKPHNPSGLKLLNIPQAHKVKKIWIAFSANLWCDNLRAKNKENEAVMQAIVLGGGSPNTFQPSATNLRLKVLECGADRWTVVPHEFPFVSLTPRDPMNPGASVNLVDHLAAELTRTAATHPATNGKELAIVLRDPVGIAAELNYLRLRRNQLILKELSKPEIAHPYNSSAALMGMQDKFVQISALNALDNVSRVRQRSSVPDDEFGKGSEWIPLSKEDRNKLLNAIPAELPDISKHHERQRIADSGRLVYHDQDVKTRKWIEDEKAKMWAKLTPHYDEEKRAAWMKAHEERMQVAHYNDVELCEKDWLSAVKDTQTIDYFREHFDAQDPNDPNQSHCPGGVYTAESVLVHTPHPESKGEVLTFYLKMLSADVFKDDAILLRALVFNQESLFQFVATQVTGDPGDTGMRDKIFDIMKEVAPNKKFSWLGDGYAFFGVGQMTALAAASLSGAAAFLKNTSTGRHILAQVQQTCAVQNSIENWRIAARSGALRDGAPKVTVLMSHSIDRIAAFAAMKANPHTMPGMTKKEVYRHTTDNQKITIAIMTDTDAIRAAGGDVAALGRTGNAVDVKVGDKAKELIALSRITLSEAQVLVLLTAESSKTTVAVNAIRSTLATGQRTGISAITMSLDGRLALASIVVQAIGIYHTFLTIKNEKDAEKVRDAWLGMFDSAFGAVGGLMQMLSVAVEAYHRARTATPALAKVAIEQSRGLSYLRFASGVAGLAGGAVNAYATWIQAGKAKTSGNMAASDLYGISSFMFAGTAITSIAVGAGALAGTAAANGSTNALVRALAGRGAGVTLLRVAGVTVLSASGIGWALLIVGVGAQLTAIALTPSQMQRWVARSYFGRDQNMFGRPDGRRSDSFPRGGWLAEKAGLIEAMQGAAKENEKYLADEAAAKSKIKTK